MHKRFFAELSGYDYQIKSKSGFSAPVVQWLRKELRPIVLPILEDFLVYIPTPVLPIALKYINKPASMSFKDNVIVWRIFCYLIFCHSHSLCVFR